MHWRAEERLARSVLHHFSPALALSLHWVSCGKLTRVEAPSGRDSLPVDAVITVGIFKSVLHSEWGTAVSKCWGACVLCNMDTVTIHPTETPIE